eukprot:6406947-Amphidinium_carterae.2
MTSKLASELSFEHSVQFVSVLTVWSCADSQIVVSEGASLRYEVVRSTDLKGISWSVDIEKAYHRSKLHYNVTCRFDIF